MDDEWLFVYGTLRKDFGLKLMQQLEGSLHYVGSGQIEARLYDLGSYPGAVKGTSTDTVQGDLFRIAEPAIVLPALDEYEGEEYRRAEVGVKTSSGTVLKAWVYWYIGTTDKALLIEETDYLHYLTNKKDRFV